MNENLEAVGWFRPTAWQPWQPSDAHPSYPASQGALDAFPDAPQPSLPVTLYSPPSGLPDLPLPMLPMRIPGLVGELVDACWNGATHQLAEAAIASALSAMSLLCSRVYRYEKLGLSLYLLLLAETSTGKSFAQDANDQWLSAVINRLEKEKPPILAKIVMLNNMMQREIGSAEGLVQHFQKAQASLFYLDEFVAKMKIMSRNNVPPHLEQIKSEMLRFMELSNPGRVYRGAVYSKRGNKPEENDIISPALTVLATGTPGAFYNDLSADMVLSGFLPRFTVLEYEGGIPMPNDAVLSELPPSLTEKLYQLYNFGYMNSQQLNASPLGRKEVRPYDATVKAAIKNFEYICLLEADNANKKDMPTAGLWSRAKEHVKQIASLIAIGCNPHMPTITGEHLNIAIDIVKPGIEKLCKKFERGEVGMGDDRRMAKIRENAVKLYVDSGHVVIRVSDLRNDCVKAVVFSKHPLGAIKAFDAAIDSMIKYGELLRVEGDNRRAFCVQLNMEVFKPLLAEYAKKKKKR